MTHPAFKRLVFLVGIASFAACVSAQTPTPAPAAEGKPKSEVSTPAVGAIKGQNIYDVQPEASDDPNYLNQTNGERARVQPKNNAPMWRQVGAGVTGTSSLPLSEAPEAGNLIQKFVQFPGSRVTNAGEAWRQVRNNWLIPYGGALLVLMVLALGIFYKTRGEIKNHAPDTGRKIERFTPFERAAHWANAIAFVILAISGVVMAFGKFFLLPLMGGTLFGWLTYLLKNAHNFAGPLFAVSLVVVFVTFVKDNFPQKGDIKWLLKGGGMFGGSEPASNRFNAGEKVVFWGGVLSLGLLVISSGFVLDKIVPGLVYERYTMQIAHMVHSVATVLMMVMFTAHIYLGTIGMQDAYKGMRTGYVDETWAKEHHEWWYDDVKAGKIPVQRSPVAGSVPLAQPIRSATVSS